MDRKGLKSDLIAPKSAKNVLFFDSDAKRELRLNVARKTVIMPPRLAGRLRVYKARFKPTL